MPNYEEIKSICDRDMKISREVVDDYLIYYAARKDKLEKEMFRRFDRFSHILPKFDPADVNRFYAQYLSHRIFKKDGLVNKYLNHSEIKDRRQEFRDYLRHYAENPWQFSFSVILDNPYEDFYKMEDVFTGESFLLYSPATTQTLQERSVTLWFNLRCFNGACWQTYGPIGAFGGFDPDDIYFFATELNPNKDFEDDMEVAADIEENPVPYIMLYSGAQQPVISTKAGDRMLYILAEYDIESLDTSKLTAYFNREYNADVYRLGLKEWDQHPHFAVAYYDEPEQLLSLTAVTERGFDALLEQFNKLGFNLTNDPDVRVNPNMLMMTEEILNKEVRLFDYERLFKADPEPEEQESMDKLNQAMNMALPAINAGKEPDYRAIAQETGMSENEVRDILKQIRNNLGW